MFKSKKEEKIVKDKELEYGYQKYLQQNHDEDWDRENFKLAKRLYKLNF